MGLEQSKAELVTGICSIKGMESLGILFIDETGKNDIWKQPDDSLNPELNLWITVAEKQPAKAPSYMDGVIKSTLSSRGMACVGIGAAAILGSLTAGAGWVAGAGMLASAGQCGIYIGQVGNALFDVQKNNEIYNSMPETKFVDSALEAIDLGSSLYTGGSAVRSLLKTPMAGGQLAFEAAMLKAASRKNTLDTLLFIRENQDLLIWKVYDIISASHSATNAAQNVQVKDIFDIQFSGTKGKQN